MAKWSDCAICGRAIPLGELCYGIKNWKGDPEGGETICKDCLVPENFPTLTPPNEWVSAEKALPPEHETVLCIVSGKPKSNITLEDAYQLGSWNKADGWIIDEWLDWEGANVTWWMKFPESPDRRPPEGKEGGADRG
mgnify:CR=1 FL=1